VIHAIYNLIKSNSARLGDLFSLSILPKLSLTILRHCALQHRVSVFRDWRTREVASTVYEVPNNADHREAGERVLAQGS
jgi:hypothetical protein